MARPGKRSWSIQLHPFSPESDLAAFEHDPQNYVTERRRENSTNERSQTRIRAHQLGNDKTRDNSHDRSANGDQVGNNEVLEIDEGCDEQDRNENPIGDRDFLRKIFPDGKKQKSRQQFDAEIAKSNHGPELG